MLAEDLALVSVSMNLFGNRVTTDVIKLGWGHAELGEPYSIMTRVFFRRGEETQSYA